MKLVLATRSGHKLHEIRTILRGIPSLDLLDLHGAGVPFLSAEDEIEVFETFDENAIAKACYFQPLTGLPTVADDSGLVVDALGGAPGVHSKRFAPSGGKLEGEERDRENLEHLLRELSQVSLADRTARYVCVAALATGSTEELSTFTGRAEGLILDSGRGERGFGYDPIFLDRSSGKTFAELTPAEKNAVSHRGAAFRLLAGRLSDLYPI